MDLSLKKRLVKLKTKMTESPLKRLVSNKLYRQLALVVLSVVLCVILVFAITTAWYSNVIYSSGLEFESAPWGFEGTASISSDIITASPGSSGTIPISVSNPTDQVISVSVNISKTTISDIDIQKRIFFYADDSAVENDEVLNKVYINKLSSYNYTLFGGQELVLGGDTNNNTAIKWEWVYDVVGYYVLASFDQHGENIIIEDYLRPVEYDYDKATFDDDGNLLTVDGETTVGEFLEDITSKDGYKGVVNGDIVHNGYYPVELDENGYGVWIYLCTRGEIEYSMTVDTMLGSASSDPNYDPESPQFNAVLNIVGQQKKLNITQTASTDRFVNAFADEDCDMIKLTEDISVNENISIPEGKEMIVDLNGHTVNTSVPGDLITVTPGSHLTVINGEVKGESTQNYAFTVRGGDLNLLGVTISDVFSSIYIQDQYGNGNDSRVYISDSNITGENPAIVIMGNGLGSERLTSLIIDHSEITSTKYIGISGNGTATGDGYWGTDVLIANSKVTGYYGGIYQPQRDSLMRIIDSEISGYTAVAVKGGRVVIENSKIESVDPDDKLTPAEPAFAKSGYTDTGAGIYVETNYGWEIAVEVKGENTTVTSIDSVAVCQYESDATNANITITGGRFSTDVSDFIQSETYKCDKSGDMYLVRKK